MKRYFRTIQSVLDSRWGNFQYAGIPAAQKTDRVLQSSKLEDCIYHDLSRDDGSAAVCFSCAYIFYLVITGFNRACKGKLKVAGTGTGEEMYFTSELPDDMNRLLDKWRGYISNRELE